MQKLLIKLIGILLNIGAVIVPRFTTIKAFNLFCTPVKVKLKERQKEFLRTAELTTMKQEGLPDIQVYKWGNGSKKVVFVHGWNSHSFRWIKYILQLQEMDYTIYAFDGPASGYSKGKVLNIPLYGEVFSAFVKQYGQMDYYVGHSLGAFMLQYRIYTNKLLQPKGLVLLASPGNATDFVQTYRDTLGLSKKTMNLVSNYFKEKYRPIEYYNIDRFTEGINCPTLLVHDPEDDVTSIEYSKTIESKVEDTETFYIKGPGHKLRSPEIVERVIKFLEEH